MYLLPGYSELLSYLFQDKVLRFPPIILVFVFTLGYFIFSQFPAFTRDYLVSDDSAMHSIWMGKYINENSFIDQDILVEASQQIQPTGFYLIHRFLSEFTNSLLYTKLAPFFLFFASGYFLFLILSREFGWKIATVGLILMSSFLIKPSIGFYARSFAYPLLLSFFYFYLGKRYWITALTLLLASLFYPSILLIICATICVFHLLHWLLNPSFKLNETELIILGSTVIVCGVILLIKSHSIESHPMIGEMINKAEILKMEELGEKGRIQLSLQLAPLVSMIWSYLTHALFPKLFFLVTLVYIGLLLVNRKAITRLDYLLISLLIAGIMLFIIARIFLLNLFIPIRYLQSTHVIFWYMVLIRGLSLIKDKLNRQPVIYLGVLAIAIYMSFIHFNPREVGLKDYSEYSALYEKIKTLNTKILIAGPAVVSDAIPFFSERSVLISYETSHLVYYKKYWSEIKQRYFDFYAAYLSSNPSKLRALIEKYKLDYIIIDQKYFAGEKELLFEPISSFIDKNRSGKSIKEAAIIKYTQHSIIPIDSRFSLLDCSKWLSKRSNRGNGNGTLNI